MKKILVTGGAGFLGSHLCSYLIKKKYKVICLDNFYTGDFQNIKNLEKYNNFKFIKHNIINPLNLKLDGIFHLACPASPPQYQRDPLFTLDTCYVGTKNMLNLAFKNNAKFFMASTSEIYGNPIIHPQNENYFGNVNTIGFRSCYDEGKRVAETLCMDFYKIKKVKIKIGRIFNTYGPNMSLNDGRVVSNFIAQALKNKNITIYGNGNQTRSFCYVSDLINGIYKFFMTNNKITGPVNIGNDDEISVKELAYLIKKKTNSKSKIVLRKLPQDDPIKRKPDLDKIKKMLNWKPNISLNIGLDKTIDYFNHRT